MRHSMYFCEKCGVSSRQKVCRPRRPGRAQALRPCLLAFIAGPALRGGIWTATEAQMAEAGDAGMATPPSKRCHLLSRPTAAIFHHAENLLDELYFLRLA
jgi:hypothetical protein